MGRGGGGGYRPLVGDPQEILSHVMTLGMRTDCQITADTGSWLESTEGRGP